MSESTTPTAWKDNESAWWKFKDQVEAMDAEELEACGLIRAGEMSRGHEAKWHVNQAMRLACLAMADHIGEVGLMDAHAFEAFRRTWAVAQALAPLVVGSGDE